MAMIVGIAIGVIGIILMCLAYPIYNCIAKKERKEKMRNKRIIVKWIIYWTVILGAYIAASLVFGNYMLYLPIPILAAVNFVIRIIVEFPLSTLKNAKAKKLLSCIATILSCIVVIGICGTIIENGSNYNELYIKSLDYSIFEHKSSVSYNKETGVYSVKAKNDELKILQLTDIHICGSITTIGTDRKAIEACYELIQRTQPDLIIVTGDIIYPAPFQTFSKNNLKPIYQFCTFMNSVGIPWAMVYGNHDTEAIASYDAKSFEGLYRYFKQEADCPMLYSEKQPDIYGRYNQYLRIENPDGSLNRLIFLIDSNDYVKDANRVNEYDSVHPDQIEWYSEVIDTVSAKEGAIVKSFVFMHIPFQEFADAEAALDAGDADAVYLFGENREDVSCPEHNSGFFDAILEEKSTEAVFVGHDHINNMGIKYKGVDLVYSKSIDYIAYPKIAKMTEQRGATLITLFQNGEYMIQQVDYDK